MDVEFYQDNLKNWRWRVTANNNKIVGASTEGYVRRSSSNNNLRSLLSYCRSVDIRIATDTLERPPEASHPLHFYKDREGDWRWQVKARNGIIVYASTEGFRRREDAGENLAILVKFVQQWSKESE